VNKNQILALNALCVVIAVAVSWAVFTVASDYDDDIVKPGTIQEDISHITDVQIPALVHSHQIQSDLLEGVEEAFAYVILNDDNEKDEFYKKMSDFEKRVNVYIKFSPNIEDNPEDVEETELLDAIILAQKSLVKSATVMFESHESGDLDMATVLAFEKDIDEIVPLVDELIEEEIEDINEHVHEIGEKVKESSSDDEDDDD